MNNNQSYKESKTTDPFEKIYDLISSELNDGASKKDIIEKLGLCGIEVEKAESVVDSIILSEKNILARKGMIHYISYSLLGFAIFFVCLISFLDERVLTKIAKYDAPIAFSLILVAAILAGYDGKIFAYIRLGVFNILWFSIGLLSGLLFMQDAWLLSTVHVGGTAIAMVFISIINIVIYAVNFLGPIGLGVVFGVISFVSLITAWSESDKIKNEIFKGES